MHPGSTDQGRVRVYPRHLLRLACAGLAFASNAALAYTARPAHPPTLIDCDAEAFATVLQAPPREQSSALTEARAYWLTRQLLKWPGADGSLKLEASTGSVPTAAAERFKYVADGVVLRVGARDLNRLPGLHRGQLLLVQEDRKGKLQKASALQLAGALDDLYSGAANVADLGVSIGRDHSRFKLWSPTARNVALCLHGSSTGKAFALEAMQRDQTTGVWSASQPKDLSGKYYQYLVDVFVPGVGIVRNRVTDPYSVSLSTDSKRSYIANLDAATLKPAGWDDTPAPARVAAQTDMIIYELHVRDFSSNDASVPPAHRGKYVAFTDTASQGMQHLQALSDAGLTDVHLLPVFDFATVPESGCVTPAISGAADDETQQAAVTASAAADCFNWGYDPYHFNAPEGSYASDAADGATRVREFRQMVLALHRAGLRVGMDVVYNHTTASGQKEKSVLDRIVPGYYQRLDARGAVEHSTCCDNTATENLMMGKLMIDSAQLWATQYKIDSFRFDLMGHQPRAVMEALRGRVNQATGRFTVPARTALVFVVN